MNFLSCLYTDLWNSSTEPGETTQTNATRLDKRHIYSMERRPPPQSLSKETAVAHCLTLHIRMGLSSTLTSFLERNVIWT